MESIRREPINLDEIERDMMEEIDYKTYLHKKTYGIRSMDDVDKKFNLSNMDAVCTEFRAQIEQCLKDRNEGTKREGIPYYDDTFSALNCLKEMNSFNDCVSGKLSGLY